MSSDTNRPDQQENQLSDLRIAIQENASIVDSSDDAIAMRERLDNLELLVEEFGQARKLQNQLEEYVRDLKEEVADLRNYRFWVTICSVTMSVMLFGILLFCVIATPDWFIKLDGPLQVPFIIAIGAGSVFLMSLNLRGVYRSRHERHRGDLLPESLKALLEVMRSQ